MKTKTFTRNKDLIEIDGEECLLDLEAPIKEDDWILIGKDNHLRQCTKVQNNHYLCIGSDNGVLKAMCKKIIASTRTDLNLLTIPKEALREDEYETFSVWLSELGIGFKERELIINKIKANKKEFTRGDLEKCWSYVVEFYTSLTNKKLNFDTFLKSLKQQPKEITVEMEPVTSWDGSKHVIRYEPACTEDEKIIIIDVKF